MTRPRESTSRPRVGRCLVINCRPSKLPTVPVPFIPATEIATAWIAEMRAGQAVRP